MFLWALRAAGRAAAGAAKLPFRAGKALFGKRVVRNVRKGFHVEQSRAAKAIETIYSVGWAVEGIKNLGKDWLPQTLSTVSVKIWGSAQSNMSNLFYLACAIAANTNTDKLRGFRAHVLTAGILPHDKAVQVTIAHSIGGLLGVKAAPEQRDTVKAPIPDVYSADKNWPVFLARSVDAAGNSTEAIGTVPVILAKGGIPTTSGGRPIIATTLSGRNPHPQLDGVSRQSDLTQLVFSALLQSCDPVPCPKTTDYNPVPATVAVRSPNTTVTNPTYNVNDAKLNTLQVDVPVAGVVIPQVCTDDAVIHTGGS